MDLREIQEMQKQFMLDRKWDRFDPSLVFVHLIEELGEVGSHLLYQAKYKVKGAGHEGDKSDLNMECAQVFNLFLQLCTISGIDLEGAWKDEYQRNLKRFDPEVWKKLAEES